MSARSHTVKVPDYVPVLSRGRHRHNGVRGGCFMEFASYLAGERWSDHPRCTHPLLAAVARAVNDTTSDEGRARLVPLIPAVVGLTSDDQRTDALIALHCARTAMTLADPQRAGEQARQLAVAVLVCERYLARLEHRPDDELSAASRTVLDRWPGSEEWAGAFLDLVGPVDLRDFRRHVGPSTVRRAVLTLAATSNPDAALYDLLAGAIELCRMQRIDVQAIPRRFLTRSHSDTR
jgi:hypothetical protein